MRNNYEKRDVCERIKKRIREMEYPENIKQFLIEMLNLEFEHIDESRPRLSEDYEKKLKKYALSSEEEK
ncbi:MAG: hypothetical protein QXT63_07660 [Thermoplasmata archaeon]